MPPKDTDTLYGIYMDGKWIDRFKDIDEMYLVLPRHAGLKTALNAVYGAPKTQIPEIVDVIFNEPATIVFWADGTKTVVKAQDEAFDPEKGLAMAISKKALGNKGNFNDEFKKWIEPYERKAILELLNMDNKILPVTAPITTTQAAQKLNEACRELGRCLNEVLNHDMKRFSRFMNKPEE